MVHRYLIIGTILVALLILLATKIHRRRKPLPAISEWFAVQFDEASVVVSALPPGSDAWSQSFLWSEITRVCFKSEGFAASDAIYVFTSQRPESFVIPTEANGGLEFWSKVLSRGLFPAELAIKASSLPEGASLCWPTID